MQMLFIIYNNDIHYKQIYDIYDKYGLYTIIFFFSISFSPNCIVMFMIFRHIYDIFLGARAPLELAHVKNKNENK